MAPLAHLPRGLSVIRRSLRTQLPSRLRARASYLAYRGGAAIARTAPEGLGERVSSGLARAAALVLPGRRRLVARNLGRATGGTLEGMALRRAVSRTFASYGRYWFELFRLTPDVSTAHLEARNHISGFEHVQAGAEQGNGIIVALPHVGGWETAGAWLATQGFPPAVVVEPVEPPELFEWFAEVRRGLGMDVIPLGDRAGSAVLAALRENKVVCLLCDRDIVGDGVEVEFFGEKTTLPAGPATLALRTGAVLLPAAVYFRPHGGHHGLIQPPLPAVREGRLRDDVTRVTQELASRFEELIRAAPEQWHLMQPNWPSDQKDGEERRPERVEGG